MLLSRELAKSLLVTPWKSCGGSSLRLRLRLSYVRFVFVLGRLWSIYFYAARKLCLILV